MIKERSIFRITALFFLFILAGTAAFAEDSPGSEVLVGFSPEVPVVGFPWTLTLLINHPVPDEVTVLAPPFTAVLFLERVAKNPRIREQEAAPWTLMEYRFIPNDSGSITLEPFTVISPLGITRTVPLTINVQRARGERETLRPRVSWEGIPLSMERGKDAIFSLRVNGIDSQLPPQDFFMPAIPQGVILEALELSEAERNAGLAFKLRLIPLEASVFQLPARTLRSANTVFEIPALRIQVNAPLETSAGIHTTKDVTSDSGKSQAEFPTFDFSASGNFILLKAYRAECENIYNMARNLWESGYYAEALAELRRNERDHPAGALLAPIRREAEQSLGFYNTGDESRGQRKLLLGLSAALFLLAMILPLVCFLFIHSHSLKMTISLCAVLFVIAGFFCLYWFMYSGNNPGSDSGGRGRFGVTRETPVRRAPDYAGEQLFSFREGQPVLILRGNHASWVWVTANENAGISGWIPAEAVIYY